MNERALVHIGHGGIEKRGWEQSVQWEVSIPEHGFVGMTGVDGVDQLAESRGREARKSEGFPKEAACRGGKAARLACYLPYQNKERPRKACKKNE